MTTTPSPSERRADRETEANPKDERTCPHCGGWGRYFSPFDGIEVVICDECSGTGIIERGTGVAGEG